MVEIDQNMGQNFSMCTLVRPMVQTEIDNYACETSSKTTNKVIGEDAELVWC